MSLKTKAKEVDGNYVLDGITIGRVTDLKPNEWFGKVMLSNVGEEFAEYGLLDPMAIVEGDDGVTYKDPKGGSDGSRGTLLEPDGTPSVNVSSFDNDEDFFKALGESKANEIGMHGSDGASFYDGKTFTCSHCGKVGDSFTDMAQEECPNNDRGGHQIPIFGDQLKSKRPTRADLGLEVSKANEYEEELPDERSESELETDTSYEDSLYGDPAYPSSDSRNWYKKGGQWKVIGDDPDDIDELTGESQAGEYSDVEEDMDMREEQQIGADYGEDDELPNVEPEMVVGGILGETTIDESKANEDSIGSDFDFDKLLMNTPFDEQQGRLRTARDEQSPLDNIYHSGRVADRIAGGEPDTYAQDFISDWDGKALYPNYDDLDFDWIYDSTGRKVKKVESKANELEEDGSFSVFGLIANRSEIECIAEAENFGYSCASEIFMHVYGTTKVTPEQVKQAKFILENWDLHNLHPYKTKAMYFGNESKANEEVTFAGRGELITQQDVWDAMSKSSRVDLILEAGWGSDWSMFDIKQFAEEDKFPDGLSGWGVEHMKRIAGLESKANENSNWKAFTNAQRQEIIDLADVSVSADTEWEDISVPDQEDLSIQLVSQGALANADFTAFADEYVNELKLDGLNVKNHVRETLRDGIHNWKKMDRDVRREDSEMAGIDQDVIDTIVDMSLDKIRKQFPEEHKKLDNIGVWGFGESRASEYQLGQDMGEYELAKRYWDGEWEGFGDSGDEIESMATRGAKIISDSDKEHILRNSKNVQEYGIQYATSTSWDDLSEEDMIAVIHWQGLSSLGESKANELLSFDQASTLYSIKIGLEPDIISQDSLDQLKMLDLVDDNNNLTPEGYRYTQNLQDQKPPLRDPEQKLNYTRTEDPHGGHYWDKYDKSWESKANEDGMYANFGTKPNDESWSVLTVASDLIFFSTRKELDDYVKDWDRKDYSIHPPKYGNDNPNAIESKANEGDQEWYNDWNKAVQDLQLGDLDSYERFARKYDFEAWDGNPEHNIEQAIKNLNWTIDYEKTVEDGGDTSDLVTPYSNMGYDGESKANENVASKMAYYYQNDAPKDWNDNQVSNEAEKILEETYGIKPKKEVVKEKAEESLSTVQQKIVDRKLDGVRNESIIHELKIWDNMSEEQAKKAVETTEIPLQDSIAHTLFSKKYAECNENERQELKIYAGESKAKEGVNDELLSTDAGIVKFLEGRGASRHYIDFVLRFPNSPSPAGWIRHWKDGFMDFGGGFGSALFDGDIEDAYFRADGENRGNLQKMGIRFARDDGTFDTIEDGRITGYTTESKANEDFTVSPHPNLLSDYVKRYPNSSVAGDTDYPSTGGHFFQGLHSGDLCEAWTRADLENREIMKEITGYSEEYLNKLCYDNKWGRSGTITDTPTEPYGLGESKKVNKRRRGVY